MSAIKRDRDGEAVASESVKTSISSLVEVNAYSDNILQLYVEEFENLHVTNTASYYKNESFAKISSLSISDFIKNALKRLAEEEERTRRLCHVSSFTKVISSWL